MLIDSIPKLISKYSTDIKNKILTYYGEYKLKEIYNVNDFLCDHLTELFKVSTERNSSIPNKEIVIKRESIYLIITDVYLLKLVPCQLKCCDKSKAHLVFFGELRDVKEIKYSKISSIDEKKKKKKEEKNINYVGVTIHWNKSENNSHFDNVILIESHKVLDFISSIESKRNMLLDQFIFFQDDLMKLNTSNFLAKMDDESTQNLESLIQYREEQLGNSYKEEVLRELMIMYQKLIEIFSARNDEKYLVFIEKLHKLIERDEENKKKKEKNVILAAIKDDEDESFSLFEKI